MRIGAWEAVRAGCGVFHPECEWVARYLGAAAPLMGAGRLVLTGSGKGEGVGPIIYMSLSV